ncbi:HAD family hydrolase [Haloferula sp.]|uniref:HAD family hydrolase n=1 Tax=Haloferula sp. TaxID=2497595 RepID=UPI003C75F89C
MEFSAVLFDFDGVLVDTEWAIYEAWQRTFRAHGHDLPLEIYTRCIGSDFDTWSPKTHLEDLTGSSFDWHQLDESRQVEIRRDLEQAGPMAGVIPLLDKLKSQGVRIGVVSSSNHSWVDGWLEKLRLMPYFETIVCRGDAPRIKPAPDLWLEALRRLDLPASEVLVFEDSLNGVKSAKEAGLTVYAVPNRTTAGLDFSIADKVLSSLESFDL